MNVKNDCKYYLGYKPCVFHKKDKRSCENCLDYERFENKILIIKLDALGDVLRTTSILPALAKKYPHAQITWLTRKNAKELLHKNPFIHRILAVEENYLEFVINEFFDLGICLDADPLSASILSLAKCKEKKGFITNKYGKAIPANKEAEKWWLMGIDDNLKRKNRQTYQEIIYEICGISPPIQKPYLSEEIINHQLIRQFKIENNLENYKGKIIGINTGGGKRWQWKKWILDYYVELINELKTNYPNIPIILYGGPEEIDFNDKILKIVGEKVVDAGCLNSLSNFISLVSLSDVLVTPDSLGFHISVALNKTTIVLVGPTSPWELDVYSNGDIIYPDLACIGCYLNKCDKKPNCMENITPNKIFKTIQKYL